MKTMWIFFDPNSNIKAVFDSYEKVESFKKQWLHTAIDCDWSIKEGEDWDIYEIPFNPKNVNEFYGEEPY